MTTTIFSNLIIHLLSVMVFAMITGSAITASQALAAAEENDTAFGATARGHALVIGNSQYRFISTLSNPANDATDMAGTLSSIGFKVTLKIDATHRAMETEILKFGRTLRKGGVGLFYFAGHGVQVNGRNYLIPIDADVVSPSDIRFETVDAGRVLGKMEDAGNGINIIILDACRNNPFASKFRTVNRGLTKMDAPTGSILAYATAPGSVAADGKGRNGLYTSKLLKYMQQEGLSIEDCFKKVRIEVMEASEKRQVPWESSSLTENIYFVPPKIVGMGTQKRRSSESIEITYWESIKDSRDVKQYQTYVNEFPNGAFVTLARLYIEKYAASKATDIGKPVARRDQEQSTANIPPPSDNEIASHKKNASTLTAKAIKLAFLPSLFQKDHLGAAPVKHQYQSALKAIEDQTNVSLVYTYWDDPKSDLTNIWKKGFFSVATVDVAAVGDFCTDMGADMALMMKSSPSQNADAETEVYLIDLNVGAIIYQKKSSNHIYNLLEEIESEVVKAMEKLSNIKLDSPAIGKEDKASVKRPGE